jgi:hypothetical protein
MRDWHALALDGTATGVALLGAALLGGLAPFGATLLGVGLVLFLLGVVPRPHAPATWLRGGYTAAGLLALLGGLVLVLPVLWPRLPRL